MIDSHLHLQDPRLGNPAEIIATVRDEPITCLVINGTSPEDWGAVAALAGEYPEVLPSYGLHPWKVNGAGEDWLGLLTERLSADPVAGVGEIGLDRWIRDHDPVRQREVFLEQLSLAARFGRPVTVHCLKAWGTLLECLAGADLSAGCLLHSYGGPAGMVGDFASLGVHFSLSGYFFRDDKAEKLSVFEKVPSDRILLETDAPDMLPPPAMVRYPLQVPDGEAINHPGNLTAVYQSYAAWCGLSLQEAGDRIARNFTDWFYRGGRARFLSRIPGLSGR